MFTIPASFGDAVDRIAICRLKTERIADPERVRHARRELDAILRSWRDHGLPPLDTLPVARELAEINGRLWEVEDALRACERDGDFGPRFVELARSVYRLNDRRAACKRRINAELGSELVEVKSYGEGPPRARGARGTPRGT